MAHLVTIERHGEKRPRQELVIGGNAKDVVLSYMQRPETYSVTLKQIPYAQAISNRINTTGI